VELPEKQGLKPKISFLAAGAFSGCSGTSRKTRIETATLSLFSVPSAVVAVELPEKQGLKLF